VNRRGPNDSLVFSDSVIIACIFAVKSSVLIGPSKDGIHFILSRFALPDKTDIIAYSSKITD